MNSASSDIAKRADLIPQADTTDPVHADDPAGSPTGMFAGETDQTRREEAEARSALELDGSDRTEPPR